MEADISELADDEGALSDEEKREREAAILAEILEIEREEVAAIEDGAPCALRPDCDPRAVLNLASDLPATVPMF